MFRVELASRYAKIKIGGSREEFGRDLQLFKEVVPREDRQFLGTHWVLENPERYADKLPALKAALEDRKRQMELPI